MDRRSSRLHARAVGTGRMGNGAECAWQGWRRVGTVTGGIRDHDGGRGSSARDKHEDAREAEVEKERPCG